MAALTLAHAAERFRLRQEPWEQARCLRSAGDVGDPRSGLRELNFVRTAKAMLEGMGDTWGVARTLLSEGAALARLHRYGEAANTLRQALEGLRELGDRWWQARSLGNAVGQGRAQAVLARATAALRGGAESGR
jgi:hypothetical protein